ncbi:hypothetical protein JSO61_000530 [Riemerella anatipestifer]|uniref:hypothetical protein n=1 Tax=Riemerella anatipestifer TaxID=34085 RepID=UPI0030C311EF
MKFVREFSNSKLDITINLLFILSLLIYILINFFLINIDEFFIYGYELGLLASNLCTAYFTSFIFYTLTVKIREIKDKQNITPFIRSKLINIVMLKQGINNTIINSTKPNTIHSKSFYTKSDYKEYFSNFILGENNIITINPFFCDTKIEFTEFILHQIKNINNEINEIIVVSQTHHSKLILLCSELINTNLFVFIINNEYNIRNQKMTFQPPHIDEISLWFEEFDNKLYQINKYLMNNCYN